MTFDKKSFQDGVKSFLRNEYDLSPDEAAAWQVHNAIARTVMGDISDDMKKVARLILKQEGLAISRLSFWSDAQFITI